MLALLFNAVQSFKVSSPSPLRGHVMMKANSNGDEIPGTTSNVPLSPLTSIKFNAIPLFATAAVLLPLLQANAAESSPPVVEEPKVDLGPPPTDFTLKNDYYADCQQVVNHMRYAIQLEKGNPLLPEIATKTKSEMIEFVSFYRRFQGVAGKQSFSLLYTSINVLSGHYTSYGVKFPVPEKRRKRLLQEMNDIEKNIRKKR